MNNIAIVYKNQGNSSKALELLQESLKIYQSLYPDNNHPSIVRTLNNISSTKRISKCTIS
jgi:hypothetical protein